MSSAANDRIGRDDIRPAGSVEARESWAKTVFDHDRARHALRHAAMDSILASRPIAAGAGAAKLPARPRTLLDRLDLPEATATYLGVPALGIDLDQLLELVGTRGLLVWHGGEVVAERYLKSHSPDVRWMTNSASKLVVAMLVARAQQEGVLGADETLLTAYWPELVGTAWDGVTIGHCRQMTTGVAWEEESLDVSHDGGWPRLLKELAFGSIDSYPATVPRRDEPGDVVRYSSLDTEVLGGVLVRAAGAGIAELVERWLWQPAGMESDAYWLCDQGGREFALSGLCATLRDYARLGLILLNRGSWNGRQLVPAEFCDKLSTPDAELFTAEGHDAYPLVVWEQAFIPSAEADQRGDFMAAGSYGQIIYVDPRTRTVVAHQGVVADITVEYIDLHRLFMAFRSIGQALHGDM